jgi:hypothetical protein
MAVLQTRLAATGICIGCRLCLLRRWVPSQAAWVFRRAEAVHPHDVRALHRVG